MIHCILYNAYYIKSFTLFRPADLEDVEINIIAPHIRSDQALFIAITLQWALVDGEQADFYKFFEAQPPNTQVCPSACLPVCQFQLAS